LLVRRALPHCADLDQATDALIGAGYGVAGERCMAISVAVAVGDVGDRLIEKLRHAFRRSRSGPASTRSRRWARW
jgi:malonate-semialdehyde dehydrogenase (acetylating)/methylmalonate-semialdehyde dehydrogenase